MADEPDNLVLQLLRGIRADMATGFSELRADVATKTELAELRAELKGDINSLRADVASDLLTLRAEVKADFKAMGDQVAGVRRALFEHPSSVIGHGVLISELEARLRRVEKHLDLPPVDAFLMGDRETAASADLSSFAAASRFRAMEAVACFVRRGYRGAEEVSGTGLSTLG
jgi:hypothetical protein